MHERPLHRRIRRRVAALRHWLPAFLYMGLIWTLSSMPMVLLDLNDIPFRDKGVHMVEYAFLGFLLAHATLRTWPRRSAFRTLCLAFWITVLWGLFDEMHQAFVPGRSSEVLDLVADTLGAWAGVVTRYLIGLVFRMWRGHSAGSHMESAKG